MLMSITFETLADETWHLYNTERYSGNVSVSHYKSLKKENFDKTFFSYVSPSKIEVVVTCGDIKVNEINGEIGDWRPCIRATQDGNGASYWLYPYKDNQHVKSGTFVSWSDRTNILIDVPYVFISEYKGEIKVGYTVEVKYYTTSETFYTVEVEAEEGGTVSGEGNYREGTPYTIHAYPDSGYSFAYWKDQDGYTYDQPDCLDYALRDVIYTAFFTRDYRTITLEPVPSAGGTVKGAGTYPSNGTATFIAYPNEGYEFAHWGMNFSGWRGTNPWTENFKPSTTANDYYAYFRPSEDNSLTIAKALDNDLSWETEGEPGLVEWYPQSLESKDGMHAMRTRIDAQNAQIEAILKTTVTGPGTIYFDWKCSKGRGQYNLPAYGGFHFYVDGKQKISVDRNYETPWTTKSMNITGEGEHILKWSYYFNQYMHFEESGWLDRVIWVPQGKYYVRGKVSPSGSGTLEGTGVFEHGQNCTLRAIPKAGYVFKCFSSEVKTLSEENPYTFTVSEDQDIIAEFLPILSVTVGSRPPDFGTATVSGSSFVKGTECTLSATPFEGNVFRNWLINGKDAGTNPNYTFTVDEESDCLACFMPSSWGELNPSDYTCHMTIKGLKVFLEDGTNLNESGSILAVFDGNGNCRGVGQASPSTYGLFNLDVYSSREMETNLQYKVIDAFDGKMYDVQEKLIFRNNTSLEFKTLTAIPMETPALKLISITISGADTIANGATETYGCTATWSNGETSEITPLWSLVPTDMATLSNNQVTNTNPLTTTQTVTLNASHTFGDDTVTATKTITLLGKEIAKYDLTVVNGIGGGSYSAGTNVTVTADEAQNGSRFSHWTAVGLTLTNAQRTSNPLTITMPEENVTVTAVYQYKVTVVDGTASKEFALPDDAVTITANDRAGEHLAFDIWTASTDIEINGATSATTTFVMPARPVTVTATYADEPKYAYTVVNGTPASGRAYADETVTISANDRADEHLAFDRWTASTDIEIGGATSATTTFVMPARPVTVTATYADEPKYAYTVVNGTPASGRAYAGETVTVTANEIDEKEFTNWTAEGIELTLAQLSGNPLVFTMPGNNVLLTANYEDIMSEYTSEKSFKYTIENDQVTIIKFIGDQTNVSIPPTIEGKPVIKIDSGAFNYCRNLVSVTIPENVSEIDHWNFFDCPKLKSIDVSLNNNTYTSIDGILFTKDKNAILRYPQAKTGNNYIIPTTVNEIGKNAFRDCNNLESIIIPYGVANLDFYTFGGCQKLSSINIPDSVRIIDLYAFDGCDALTTVVIPDSVECINNRAFEGCLNLKSVTIGAGVYIFDPSDTFAGCYSLESIEVSADNNSFTSDDGVLFSKDMHAILLYPPAKTGTKFDIPNGVTHIGSYAFRNCSNLISVSIPDGVTRIGYATFENCTKLESINLPESLTYISYSTFGGCSSLSSVNIPAKVTDIKYDAFENCQNLKTINVSGDNMAYISVDGVLFTKDMTMIIQYPSAKNDTEFTVPASVTDISNVAFDCNTNLKAINVSIDNQAYTSKDGVLFTKDMDELLRYPPAKSGTNYTIPKGVEYISNYAFANNINLTSVSIPYGVEIIGSYAFANNINLTSLSIPNSVIDMRNMTFENCSSLETIIIPQSVEWIDPWSFDGCTSLKSIIVINSEQLVSYDGVLYDIYYDDNDNECFTLSKYPASRKGNTYAIHDGAEDIDSHAFADCKNLASVTVPASVTKIYEEAFARSSINSIIFKGEPPVFYNSLTQCYPTPITFYVPENMGWEEWEAPEGVTVIIDSLSQIIPLQPGWNLVTLTQPIINESAIHFLALNPMRFDTEKQCFVRCLSNADVQVGMGYCIFSIGTKTLQLTLDKAQSSWTTVGLNTGWNLIGLTDSSNWMNQASSIWQWDNDKFQRISLEDLTVGNVYWVKQDHSF